MTKLADRTARRLQWRRTLDDLPIAVMTIGAIMLVLAVYDRWPGGPRVNWWWVGGVLVGGVGVWLLVSAVAHRFTRMAGALVLDERLDTRDVFSTALAVEPDPSEPMTIAMHEHAANFAKEIGAQRGPQHAVPMTCPRGWWWGLFLLIPAVAVLLFDPLPSRAGTQEDPQDLVVARANAVEAVSMMQQQLDASPELSEAIGMDTTLQAHQALDDPAAVRRETLRDLTELSKRLERFQNGTQSRSVDEVRQRLEQVAPGGSQSKTSDIRRAMAQGDLEAMAEAIDQARDDTDQTAAGDLEALAGQIRTAAADTQSLADALKGAGMDPSLADQPEALDEAIAESDHLSMQQQQDLESLAQEQQQASESLEDLAEELDTVAGQCRNSGPAKDNQAKPSAKQSSQSSQSSQSQQSTPSSSQCTSKSLAKSQRAQRQASQCQGQCQSSGKKAGEGSSGSNPSSKTGGKGRGQGALAGDDSGAVNFNRTRVRSDVNTASPVIMSSHVKADTVRGSAQATPGSPMEYAQRRLEDGVDVKAVPRRYRAAVAAWFSSLKPAAATDDDQDDSTPSESSEESSGEDSPSGSESESP